jgi:sugar/nucleoside kinase (ribokinase family)
MTLFDVVGFGALNVDRLFKVNRIAHAEEESFIETMHETCGGSAANTIVGLARLGCKVGFLGKVGPDSEGDKQVAEFRNELVDIGGVIRAKRGKSGSVMGFVDKNGARALYINSGVNDSIETWEVGAKYFSETRFLHFTSFVGEKSFQTQKKLLEKIPDKVRISFDPGNLYARRGFSQLEAIIKATYVLMPNLGELELLTGYSDYVKGADALIAKGVKVVAVKLGSEGSYITNGRQRHRIEAFDVKVKDTTGAGDAFCAGFLFGLLKNRGLQECGKIGNFVASRCVMKIGARTGLPSASDLKFLN